MINCRKILFPRKINRDYQKARKKKLENELIDLKRENVKLVKKFENNSNPENTNIEKRSSTINMNDLKNNYLEFMKNQSSSSGDIILDSKNFEIDIVLLELNKSNDKIKVLEKEVFLIFYLDCEFKIRKK